MTWVLWAMFMVSIFNAHPPVPWQPDLVQTQNWRWMYRQETYDGCGYVDWSHRETCAQRHGLVI